MIRENKKKLILTSIVILIPVLLGLILWNKLPDKVPTHWNSVGEVDGWSSKVFAVFGLPGFLFVIHWVCILVTTADPKIKNIQGKMLSFVFWICPVISLIVVPLCYAAALGMEWKVEKIMPILVGVMFLIVGNYLPKCEQSYTMGIKLPWTLNDEENWNRTHRLGGKLWVACGIIMILGIFLPTEAIFVTLLVVIGLAVLVPAIYSYRLFREKAKREEEKRGE